MTVLLGLPRVLFPEPYGGFADNEKLPLYSGNSFRIFPKRIENPCPQ
jgi:hypothetical protein